MHRSSVFRLTPIHHALLFAGLCSATAFAAEPTLDTIIVTGTAIRHALSQPGIESAREEAASVVGGANVVDAESFRSGRVATLKDTLEFSPGVLVQPRFGAEEARLSIRGSGLQRTFHGRGIKLMQDGVPLNLADGSFDFQALEPLATRYVTVYRGANALQYGATTLGGAINYVSPSGVDAASGVRAEAGAFGYRREQLRGAIQSRGLDGFVSLAGFRQDGYRTHAVQDARRLIANAGWRVAPAVETRFYIADVHSNSELPGNLTRAQLVDNPRQAAAGNLALNQKRDIDLSRVANRTVIVSDAGRFTVSAYFSGKTLFHPIFQVLDQRNRDAGAELRWETEGHYGGLSQRLVLGMLYSRGSTHEDRWANIAGQRGARTGLNDQLARNTELYAEQQLALDERLWLSLGVQSARAERRFDDHFLSDGDQSFDASYRGASPKLGLRYALTPAIELFGNLSRSDEPPSFGELAGGVNVSQNAAQRATTLEIGSRGRWGERAGWDISLYSARLKDELLSLNTPAGQPLGTINAPRTLHRGVELGAEWSCGPVTLREAWQFNDFRFEANASYGDNRLPGVPRQFSKTELGLDLGSGLYAGINADWSPQRYAVDMAGTLFADPYAIWGLKLGQHVGKRWQWFVDARNLSDKRYAAATGVIADARGTDSAQFLPGDGRAVYAGLEWMWR